MKIILIFLAFVLAAPLFINLIQSDGSMLVNGSGDGLWHVSLASEIKKQIPPSFPGMAGFQMRNYHYYSDLIWGIISKVTGISTSIIYFQIGSILICFLLVLSTFKLAQYFTKSNFWSLICVVTTLFLGSASFVKPLFIKGTVSLGNNFMLDQPYGQLINLHTGIGYILVIVGTLMTFRWLTSERMKYGVISAIIFASLFGFKSFFAIPMALAFVTTCLFFSQKTRLKRFIPAITLIVLSAVVYLSISDKTSVGASSPIYFRPGWLLTKMIEDGDRFNLEGYYLKQIYYESAGNLPRLIQMGIEKVIIFILGNYWVKLFGLVYLFRYFNKYPKENIFISLCIIFSVSLTLLLVPQPDPFNAVQFGQVSVLFMGILLGLFLFKLNNKILLIPIFIAFGVIFVKDYFTQIRFHEYLIPKEEVAALKFIRENTNSESIIMVDPIFDNKKMKVTALGERRTFYSGDNLTLILGIDDSNRKEIQHKFFQPNTDKAFIKTIVSDNKIDYIYTQKPSMFEEFGYSSVFSNSKVIIFKTVQK